MNRRSFLGMLGAGIAGLVIPSLGNAIAKKQRFTQYSKDVQVAFTVGLSNDGVFMEHFNGTNEEAVCTVDHLFFMQEKPNGKRTLGYQAQSFLPGTPHFRFRTKSSDAERLTTVITASGEPQ